MILYLVQAFPVIIVVVVAILIVRSWRTTHLECPACGCAFKMPLFAFVGAFHAAGRRYTTCPDCHYIGMMDVVKDQHA